MRTAFLALSLAATALGVTTSDWTHTSEEDFAGENESIVVSPFGELRLSRASTTLLEQDAALEITYAALGLADGSLIIASGPEGTISRVENNSRRALYAAKGNGIATSLALGADGKVLAGISGERAILIRLDPDTGESVEVYSSDDIQFIWAIHPLPDGSIILGTGPTGQLLQVARDGKARVVLQTKQKNILSVVGNTADMVIVGTDPDGLVMRVNVVNGDWFVLYDAAEPEIVALAMHPSGDIYAAASTVVESASPDEGGDATGGKEIGPDVPIRREPPAAPEPPVLPDPAPGEPEPIPQEPVAEITLAQPNGDVGDEAPELPAVAESPGAMPSSDGSSTSAVYRIAPAGFVSEAFRAPLTIHSMLLTGDTLLLGTGPEGVIHEVKPTTEEHLTLIRTKSRQISTLVSFGKDRIAAGLSNPGGLMEMSAGYAAKGIYTSEVLDAGQVALFGKLQLQGTMPTETAVSVSTRSGNLQDPEAGGWSAWSEEAPAAEFMPILSPAARFAQYRLTFLTRDPAASPAVEEVKLNYLLPNMPPRVNSIMIEAEAAEIGASPEARVVNWDVSDPNSDSLVYELHYRMGHRGSWILIKDKLEETTFRWNTRQLADGRYQLRLTASDQRANAAGEGRTAVRFSESVRVDNTAPAIGDIVTEVKGADVEVKLRVVDRTSTVSEVQYSLDSSDDWQAAGSSDMLYDSPDETVRFVARGLSAGPHQVAVRARDSQGNTAYEALIVTVDKKE